MSEELHAWLLKWGYFLITSLCGASAAGVAAQLRDGQPVQWGQLLRAAFVSGVVGAVFLSALWDSLAESRPGWLIAVVLCAGAGGGNMLDAVAHVLRRAVIAYGKTKPHE